MKCNNCNHEINDDSKKCIYCGKELNKKKISIVSIISLIILIISIVIPIIIIFYAFSASAGLDDVSAQGYGWLTIFTLIGGSILATYFGTIFIVSLIMDLKNKNVKNKNIIMSILLLLPLLIVLLFFIISSIAINKKKYTFKEISVEFPKDMTQYSSRVDFSQKYTEVGFFYRDDNNYECKIICGVNSYKDNMDMINNLKEVSNRFTFLAPNVTVYDIFDNIQNLNTYNINNKNWYYYEKQFQYEYYKIYGIVIENNIYKIETFDSNPDHTSCNNRINNFLNSVKYNSF